MPVDEGDALHAAAVAAAASVPGAPFVEVGSYCGRSTIWLAAAARHAGTVVFAVDHHRGSEENQAGWEHHDPDVVDPGIGRIDTLPMFRRALFDAGLERYAIAVVGESPVVAAHWTTPAALVFIDGGHGVDPARADYAGWSPKVAGGGKLVIHDVFPDPAEEAGRRTRRSTCRRSPAAGSWWSRRPVRCGVLRRVDAPHRLARTERRGPSLVQQMT